MFVSRMYFDNWRTREIVAGSGRSLKYGQIELSDAIGNADKEIHNLNPPFRSLVAADDPQECPSLLFHAGSSVRFERL